MNTLSRSRLQSIVAASIPSLLVVAALALTAALALLQPLPIPAPEAAPAPAEVSVALAREALAGYEVEPDHTQVLFRIRHMGISTVTGTFDRFAADVAFNPADPTAFAAEATIEAASVNTGIAKRDQHLRSDDFFDAEAFPELTFASGQVSRAEDGRLQVEGDLTIRGVTRPVTLDVAYAGPKTDP